MFICIPSALMPPPRADMIGMATMISPLALQPYFIRNCSNIMYHNFFVKIKSVC